MKSGSDGTERYRLTMSLVDFNQMRKMEGIKDILDQLTDDERHQLFSNYCGGCGSKEPRCYCLAEE